MHRIFISSDIEGTCGIAHWDETQLGRQEHAPFAAQIMEEALAYLGVPPNDPKASAPPRTTVPDVVGMTVKEARLALSESQLLSETDGLSDVVSAQAPAAGAQMPAGSRVMLYSYTDAPLQAMDVASVPDVMGLSMVEAERQLRARGFDMEIAGSGLAVRQEPAAGSYAALGAKVKVTFQLPTINGTE